MEHLMRQWDIIPEEVLGQKINIVGCGAIGSFTALGLVKMGFTNLSVWDFDEIEIENMSNQWFRFCDIGKNKAEALKDLIHSFTNESIEVNGEYKGEVLSGFVISAVDSMSVRRLIYDSHKKANYPVTIIDPRMSSEYATLHTFSCRDKDYEKTLFSDEDGVQERCTAKSTMYTAMMISGLVCKAVKDLVTTNAYPKMVDWNILDNSFSCFTNEVNSSIDHKGVENVRRNGHEQSVAESLRA